jgi:hypothetical protein
LKLKRQSSFTGELIERAAGFLTVFFMVLPIWMWMKMISEHRTTFPRKTIDLLVESGLCATFPEAEQKLKEGYITVGKERKVAGETIDEPTLLYCYSFCPFPRVPMRSLSMLLLME